jgi:hypothetical protein
MRLTRNLEQAMNATNGKLRGSTISQQPQKRFFGRATVGHAIRNRPNLVYVLIERFSKRRIMEVSMSQKPGLALMALGAKRYFKRARKISSRVEAARIAAILPCQNAPSAGGFVAATATASPPASVWFSAMPRTHHKIRAENDRPHSGCTQRKRADRSPAGTLAESDRRAPNCFGSSGHRL